MESNKTDNTPKQTMVYICGCLKYVILRKKQKSKKEIDRDELRDRVKKVGDYVTEELASVISAIKKGALGEHFAVHREFLRQPALHQMDDSEPLLYSHDTSDIQMTTPPVCKEKKHRKKQPVYYCDSIARYK
ncbi:uncharacterized protein LOC100118293 isoform X1 [Nasonia vitripennis]|uniref:Uncharacterized protein n=1 Tax=Nasonia vitripennis TaxID=7425 RepID=A0A7M7R624_NASVI|nr:uncharacterized protein LOC100118293 isoform X1 [Nasonia vitripennis]XP_032458091.1 uncharacterized protein LOC100118293 isoform X1 [Nasonia vitripennis]